nr:HWE histidine kinase domain-containing protein [Caulobacter sp. 602-2]
MIGSPVLTDPALAALIIENARDFAILTLTPDGMITSWSPGAERITGYTPRAAIGQSVDILLTAPDLAAGAGALEISTAFNRGRAEDSRWHVRRDKEWFWANGVMVPFQHAGECALLKIMRDETPAKLAAEHRILLLNELNHRIKNTLATVQSVTEQTLRAGGVAASTRQSLTGRLMALSKVHDVLTQESWASADLAEVVGKAVAPFQVAEPVIGISGPPVRLSPNLAVAISLALHELATNANKFGALNRPGGRVEVSWTDAHDGVGQRFLNFLWRESGGPPVSPPERRGFGARLLSRVFADARGEARLDFAASGVCCVITLPLSEDGETPILKVAQDPRGLAF